ncbi:MAG: beta-ketoacyl synthase [Verrucomicrobiaceae bacterium]|nr:beta-ketoacyl synthase [Verrucomicrobiaceae bacterium]
MSRVVVTGLGFTTSIGNNRAEVLSSLREVRSGVEIMPELLAVNAPVRLAGTIKGFQFPSEDPLDWVLPPSIQMPRTQLRTMTPNALYAYAAMQEAIGDARLDHGLISNPDTGLYCASSGCTWLTHATVESLISRGASRTSPSLVIAGMPNSLHLNLTARFQIKGASLGFSSACASSAHALGSAYDLIKAGRQKIMFVVGAEDCHIYNILAFAAVRALSVQTDPKLAPRAFDSARDGFVVSGGGCVLVIEDADHAAARGATVHAEVSGWGQATDGYDVVAPDPSGNGLARAMGNALKDARMQASSVDYINAHATATLAGDMAELKAVREVFGGAKLPWVSSTKSLTGHGLSLAGAMEAAFCCLALEEKFTPVSANITQLDPACGGVPVVTEPIDAQPRVAISNSSGFGGANVSVVLSAADR